LAISVSPVLQNRSNPPPVPTEAIFTLPVNPSLLKFSATASERGYTVELPAILMSPVRLAGSTSGSIPSGTASVATSVTASVTGGVVVGAAVGVQAVKTIDNPITRLTMTIYCFLIFSSIF